MYVNIASIQRTGRVLQLADYRKVANGDGEMVTRPHGAIVMFDGLSGALYPFEMMTVVAPPPAQKQEQHDQPRKEPEPVIVWRWCPCCWNRTDHKPVSNAMLACTVCGNRVPNTAPDTSNRYVVPTEDDEKLPEFAGSQQVAAG
jgi:hypothetical protein